MELSFANIVKYGYFLITFEEKPNGLIFVGIGFFICALIAYLIGSLNFGLIISKYKFKDDIREHGSGSAGMTNMMRTYGRTAAAVTFFGDFIKAVFSVIIGTLICGEMGAYIAGFFCVLGHVFPIFFKFKGGKGIAATAGMLVCLNPIVFGILLLIFVILVAFTRYISLGSIMCMLIYPLILNRIVTEPNFIVTIVSMLLAALVVFMHRANIKRLLEGTESKFSFKKSVKPDSKSTKK